MADQTLRMIKLHMPDAERKGGRAFYVRADMLGSVGSTADGATYVWLPGDTGSTVVMETITEVLDLLTATVEGVQLVTVLNPDEPTP